VDDVLGNAEAEEPAVESITPKMLMNTATAARDVRVIILFFILFKNSSSLFWI